MFKSIPHRIIFFDLETVPDIELGRRMFAQKQDCMNQGISDECALSQLYEDSGATSENPTPFLKPMFHRIIVTGALCRTVKGLNGNQVELKWLTQPGFSAQQAPDGSAESRDEVLHVSEKDMIQRLLDYAGKTQAQLIGWNSDSFDWPVLMQRALINGCIIPDICRRPKKPWEGGDYFAKFSDARLDLMQTLAGEGNYSARTKLSDMAIALGLPGKQGMDGSKVFDAYREGRLANIVRYCNDDVSMTYRIWLRCTRMAGMISEEQFHTEEQLLSSLMDDSDLPF